MWQQSLGSMFQKRSGREITRDVAKWRSGHQVNGRVFPVLGDNPGLEHLMKLVAKGSDDRRWVRHCHCSEEGGPRSDLVHTVDWGMWRGRGVRGARAVVTQPQSPAWHVQGCVQGWPTPCKETAARLRGGLHLHLPCWDQRHS